MYAIFSIRKLVATSRLNAAQAQLMNLDDQQYALATQEMSKKQEQSAVNIENAQKTLEILNSDMDSDAKQEAIDKLTAETKIELEQISMETNAIAQQENAIEIQKKALETKITKWSKELEVIEKAEAEGIDRANPKYSGLG